MTTTAVANLVTWSDRYSVGIRRIDEQHKELIALINQLFAAISARADIAATAKILDSLATYTVSHFAAEEGLMKRYDFPGYAQHKAEHDKLVARVKELQEDLRAGKEAVSRETLAFLQSWLIGHILGVDKRYTTHLQAAGVR